MKKAKKLMAVTLAAAAASAQLTCMGAKAAPMLIRGDLNRDDRVNISDIVIMKNYLLGRYGLNETQYIASDINEDGETDSLDLTALQEMIISSINRLPSGTWIGDCMGGKRYFSFGDGVGTVIDPSAGITDDFDITSDEDIAVLNEKVGSRALSLYHMAGRRVLRAEMGQRRD